MKKYLIVTLLICISCEEIINEQDISDDIVTILAPTENANLTSNTINFSWETVEGATAYHLQIAEPNFNNATQIVLDTMISILNYTKELPNTNYQWRIKGKNSAYETVYTTNGFNISTSDDFSGNTVVLQNPEDGLITNQTTQSLNWEAIEDATDYRIQIWQPDLSGTLITDLTSETNQKNITFNEGGFTWQVRAQNETANTAYSLRSILVDTTIPNTPTLLTPNDNETLTETNVNFTWQRNELAGSNESDKIFIYSDLNLTTLLHENTVENNTYDYTLTVGSTYYWIMKSFDEAGNESLVSDTFSFTIN